MDTVDPIINGRKQSGSPPSDLNEGMNVMVTKRAFCVLVATCLLTGQSRGDWLKLKDLTMNEPEVACDVAEAPLPTLFESSGPCDTLEACDVEPLCDAAAGCCGCLTCCDLWTVRAEVMFLRRSDADQLALITHQETEETLVDVENLEFDHNAAVRYQLMREYCCCWGWDIGYFGIDSWTSSGNGGGDVSPILQGPGLAFPSTAHGTIYRAEYGTDLHSAEFNVRRRFHECVTGVAGFRWIELQDQLRTLAIAPQVTDFYSIDTNNQMYGFQLGADTRLFDRGRRFEIDGIFRVGVMFNNCNQNTEAPILSPFVPAVADQISAREDHTAFLAELGIRGNIQVFRGLYATGGYGVMWLDGLALAPDQIPHADLIAPASADLDTGGTLFFHGATVGLMGRF